MAQKVKFVVEKHCSFVRGRKPLEKEYKSSAAHDWSAQDGILINIFLLKKLNSNSSFRHQFDSALHYRIKNKNA